MARFQQKPNGEIVLILSASEARGLAMCASEGYVRLSGASLGTQLQTTAARRAVMALHEATRKAE